MAGPSRNIWGFELSVLILGLLALTQQSMQQSSKHPMHELIQRIHNQGHFFGLVLASDADERALLANNAFNNTGESIELAGRKFNLGTINESYVIYVKTGKGPSINAAITVQLLILLAPKGIIHIGRAGTVNDSLSIGDVVVPKEVAFTGSWRWLRGKRGQLVFGEYNTPAPGGNLLGSISFQPTTLYATGKNKTTIFWLPLTSDWLDAASQVLENLELEQCISKDKCLPKAPVIVNGLRASTSDIYLQNKAYREFIYTKFKASTVDTESAAVTLAALSNEVPIIVFRGISNAAGGSIPYENYSYLASVNTVKAAVAFIAAVGNSNSSLEVAAY